LYFNVVVQETETVVSNNVDIPKPTKITNPIEASHHQAVAQLITVLESRKLKATTDGPDAQHLLVSDPLFFETINSPQFL
jgi:hypothetical protein